MPTDASADRDVTEAARWRALVTLAASLVLGMSTWFSASAVIPQLDEIWGLTARILRYLALEERASGEDGILC